MTAMKGWTQVLLGLNVLVNGYTDEVEGAAGATKVFSTALEDNFTAAQLAAMGIRNVTEETEELDNSGKDYLATLEKMSSANKAYRETLEGLTASREDEMATLAELEDGYWSYQDAGRAVWNDLQSIEGQLRTYRPALDATGESLKGLLGRQQELRTELSTYSQVWGKDTKAIEEHMEKLGELNLAIQENAAQHRIATNKIMLDNMERVLSVDGLSTEESLILLRMGEAWGIYEKGVAESLALATEHVGEWGDELERLPTARSFTYNLYGNIDKSFRDAMDAAGFASPIRKPSEMGAGIGAASGANFVVPPGYPNDSFPLRVQSGEHVQVTPKNQVGQGGGMQFDYSRFARIIAEELQKVSR